MTTRKFIYEAFNGRTNKEKCSSVFRAGRNIFSYGHHYPLLFRINGKNVRNVTGYSNTTQRHIMWSRDVDAIDIHAGRGFRLNGTNSEIMAELVKGQQYHVDALKRQLDAKKRKDTQVYKYLKSEYDRAVSNLTALTA